MLDPSTAVLPQEDPGAAPLAAGARHKRKRRWPWGVAVVLLLLLAEAWWVPARQQPTARLLLGAIDLYQAVLSPRFAAAGVRCRFTPSCSHYGEAVIRRFGTLRGVGLTARRLLRCGPWTAAGTLDPPPGEQPIADSDNITGTRH